MLHLLGQLFDPSCTSKSFTLHVPAEMATWSALLFDERHQMTSPHNNESALRLQNAL